MSIIKLKNVSKFYQNKGNISSGFNRINLELNMGEFVVITGESGSGKSTLLNVISGLDSYQEGEMYINDEETSHYTETDYEIYRRKYIGNIFQSFNLINSYTVYQNIELVLLLNGYKRSEVKTKILDLIKTVGLTKYKNTKVSKLSGGQKQRVAIARALAKDTPIIVADEPTGNLDVKSAASIMEILYNISKDKLVVIVTHNYEQVEKYATRKISMSDGKIIEDKVLKKTEIIAPTESEYENITKANKIMLGFRNAFNIKTKFLLLTLVYFVLTLAVFSEYSNIRKISYDNDSLGYNYNFQDSSVNRVIVNKNDRTSFTKSDIDNIKKLSNIDSVVENDILLDKNYQLQCNDVYYYGRIRSISEIKTIDIGRLPEKENEFVIEANRNEYNITNYKEALLNKEYEIFDTDSTNTKKLVLVGIKYAIEDNDSFINSFSSEVKFYLTDTTLNDIRKGGNISYSNIDFIFNGKTYKNGEGSYFNIKSYKKLNDGEAYIPQYMNTYCEDFDCKDKSININVSNIYYKESITVKTKDITNNDNIKKLTGINDYDMNANVVFISENDYNKLFDKDTYQISVFLSDIKESDKTLKELNNMGYHTIFMRDILTNDFTTLRKIVLIIRCIAFIIAAVALFFISYFVIRIILKSRNIYYSTIRILGATKAQAKSLLNIELFIDINISYILFILLILSAKNGLINQDYVSDVITYFKTIDYIIVYFVLASMSLAISNRYAHKLFKDSAMSTYREEN